MKKELEETRINIEELKQIPEPNLIYESYKDRLEKVNSIKMNKSIFNINQLLEELENYYNLNKKKDVKITFVNKKEHQKLLLFNDPVRLRQVLSNLLDNSNKYTEKGYIKFMYWVVLKYLKPLNLNNIEIEAEYSFIEIEKVNYEIQTFLYLYLSSTLGIKNFHQTFLIPILKDLGISIKKEL